MFTYWIHKDAKYKVLQTIDRQMSFIAPESTATGESMSHLYFDNNEMYLYEKWLKDQDNAEVFF